MISRRAVLGLGATALAAFVGRRAQAAPDTGPLSFDELVARARVLESDGSPMGIDAYLYTLAALAVRLTAVPEPELFPFKPRAPDVSLAPISKGRPFIVEWRMAAGAVLPPHNHPGYSVCTVGLGGEARMRHYAPPPDAPPFSSREPFRVEPTRELILRPHTVSTLAPARDNIHTFTAGPKGAFGIDIGTLHADADRGFSFLDLDEKTGLARWSGM